MAVMIVTLVLTMYMGIFILNTVDDESASIDRNVIEGLTIENGRIDGDISPKMMTIFDLEGYKGFVIRCYVPGGLAEDRTFTFGSMEGNIVSERFLKDLPSNDGRHIPVIFEVAICT